ncbi:MAG: hypothetical protein AB9866_23925 [Syntrophobacteraceae bacterium]
MADKSAVCLKDFDFDKIRVSRLEPGDLGVLIARAGAGKTACLTHVAIGYLLQEEAVLHVCVDIVPDKVKVWYHELLKSLFADRPGCNFADVQHRIEPLRFIMSFLNQTFSPEKLEQSLENLQQQANFTPSLLVLDGLDFDVNQRQVFEKLGLIARKYSMPIWMSARMHRHISDVNERGVPYPINAMDELFGSIFMLEPDGEGLKLKILKEKENYNPVDSEYLLDPHTFLLLKKPR